MTTPKYQFKRIKNRELDLHWILQFLLYSEQITYHLIHLTQYSNSKRGMN